MLDRYDSLAAPRKGSGEGRKVGWGWLIAACLLLAAALAAARVLPGRELARLERSLTPDPAASELHR